MWLEGPSGDEPTKHLSISVGTTLQNKDDTHTYFSASFGLWGSSLSGDLCIIGCVYQDITLGGKISHYVKTTPEQDKFIINYLKHRAKWDSRKLYGIDQVCIQYSQNTFNTLKQILHLKETDIPKSYIAPRDYSKYYLVSAVSSGLISFSGRYSQTGISIGRFISIGAVSSSGF
jgi:hypothetical protein